MSRYVLGIDEAGTGAWAGPFTVAGTVFPTTFILAADDIYAKEGSANPYRDSKKLDPKTREEVRTQIEIEAMGHDVGYVFPADIKKHGQEVAWQIGICLIVEGLLEDLGELGIPYGKIDVLIDGAMKHDLRERLQEMQPGLRVNFQPKADEKVLAVCAASILAKTSRDDYMRELHETCPQYGFAKHKGYGTEMHAEKLVMYGRTKYHRPCVAKWDLADLT